MVSDQEENCSSREMRKTAQESFLAVATTWHDSGSTFFADHGRSSRIAWCRKRLWDWCAPAGKRLQPFRTREGREHISVAIEIEVPLRCRPYAEARVRIDRTEL